MSTPEELLSEVSDYDAAKAFLAKAQARPEAARSAFGDDLFRQMVSTAGDAVRRKERPADAAGAEQIDLLPGAMEGVAEARTRKVSGPSQKPQERPVWALTKKEIPNLEELLAGSDEDVRRANEIQLEQEEAETDPNLRTLSKVKRLGAEPEYMPPAESRTMKTLGASQAALPLASLAAPALGIMAPAVGVAGGMAALARGTMENWEEPSLEVFQAAMRQYPDLYTGRAEDLTTDNDRYREFADAAWQVALERAKEEGRPIRRLSQMKGISGALQRGASAARAGAIGAERGITGGVLSSIMGRLVPAYAEAAQQTTAAHPVATGVGFAVPAVTTMGEGSVAGQAGSLALRGIGRVLPRLAGRTANIGVGAARGALAAGAGGAAERAAMIGADAISGQEIDPTQAAVDVADAALLSGGIGLPLGAAQGAARASQQALRSGSSPLASALRDAQSVGTRTAVVRGIEPGQEVRALNAGGANPEARLAEELSGPMLREAQRESAEYERLLGNATDSVLRGGQKITAATKATIASEQKKFYDSLAGQAIHDIDPFRDAAKNVAAKLSVATGEPIPGRSSWRARAQGLYEDTLGHTEIFMGESPAATRKMALEYGRKMNRKGSRRNQPVLEGPDEARVYTLDEMRKLGVDVDSILQKELADRGMPWKAGEPLPGPYAEYVKNARAVWIPVRMNAKEIDGLIDSIDDLLREGAKTGTVPKQFDELSQAAHSLRDRLGSSSQRMANERAVLPDGTVVSGYGAMMRNYARLTGEVKRGVQQSGVPERAGGDTAEGSELTAGELTALRSRVAGRNELAPQERDAIQLIGNQWSEAPPAWDQMSALERSAGSAGLKYPLPAEIMPETVQALRQRLVRFGEPLQDPTDQALMGLATRAGRGPRLRLMPGVRATNKLLETSKLRGGGGVGSYQGGAYGRAGISGSAARLRWDAVMRYLEELNAGAAGGAAVSPEGERRVPQLAQQVQKYW